MAVTAGIGGAVKNGANTVANVDTWNLSAKGATAKTTAFGATGSWETNTATIKSWTATCAGRVDPADTNGQLALINGLLSTFTLELDVDGTHHWAGSAILVGFDPKSSVTSTNDITFSFEGTGALTFT